MATTTLLTACSPGFCRLLRRKIDRNRRVRPESRSSRRLSLLLRQKTDPNPLSTTILSVLTASPPDWRVSQVSGERCGGEEVHEEDERDGYTHFDVSEFQPGEDTGTSHVDLTYSTDIPSNIANMMGVRTRIRDRQMHQQLKADLVEHLWRKFGRGGDNN
uniref:Uncharacterized protein n=1 Tax=Brassica oleracea var. oleracea TaxID=109376 RepID=A0A0D3C3P3_BRAOL